jgi:hypothetical protein
MGDISDSRSPSHGSDTQDDLFNPRQQEISEFGDFSQAFPPPSNNSLNSSITL